MEEDYVSIIYHCDSVKKVANYERLDNLMTLIN
jgi:hypothetical protein